MTTDVQPEVRTTAGTVRGRWEGELAVFRGIPYAAPPVGEARFAAPQPAPHWDGTRETVAFGSPAPQDYAGFRNLGLGGGERQQSTGGDWLTLNVWTPAPDRAARLPVMVWIHGGAHKMGSGADNLANARIAREGNLVLVSINYRLGIEGFAAIEGAPPNRGLLDQIAALHWVRDNIATFGGNPDRVTVFGESAGGTSVGTLMAMPAAAGLFHRAIAQSFGGPFLTPELATDITTAIARRRGRRPTVADLSTVEPNDLAMAGEETAATQHQHLDRWGPMAAHLTFFVPTVDGEVLPATPYTALAAGTGRDIELIAGHNRDEYQLFLVALRETGHDRRSGSGPSSRRLRPRPERREGLPRGLPGRHCRATLGTGPVRLALPHAHPPAGRSPRDRRRTNPLLRTDVGLPRRRWPTRRMSRPRPAVGLRRLRQRIRSDAGGRPGTIN